MGSSARIAGDHDPLNGELEPLGASALRGKMTSTRSAAEIVKVRAHGQLVAEAGDDRVEPRLTFNR